MTTNANEEGLRKSLAQALDDLEAARAKYAEVFAQREATRAENDDLRQRLFKMVKDAESPRGTYRPPHAKDNA